jgi:hypothetical protein
MASHTSHELRGKKNIKKNLIEVLLKLLICQIDAELLKTDHIQPTK